MHVHMDGKLSIPVILASMALSLLVRFTGTQPEPRPGLSSGHIPFSKSLPFTTLLDDHTYTADGASEPSSYTTLKSSEGLHKALETAVGPANASAVLKGERGVVASCGSGMSAGVIWLAMRMMGVERLALYDEVRTVVSVSCARSFDHFRSRGLATPGGRAARSKRESRSFAR